MNRSKLVASLFVAALVLSASFAQTASCAQLDQKIVIRCTYDGYNNQTLDFEIDLAAKTISGTHTFKDPNGANVVQPIKPDLTQVTDDQITWTISDSNRSLTDTLNRYTGQIVEHIAFQGGNITNTMSCQRQQKQF